MKGVILLENERLYRTFRVAGREFRICSEYIPEMEKSYPAYPDFVAFPEYTEEGRPFAHYVQEGCAQGLYREGGGVEPENCGLCVFFQREALDIPIGVCLNEKMRKKI